MVSGTGRVSRAWSNIGSQIKRYPLMIVITFFLLGLILIPITRLIISSFQLGHPAMPEGWSLHTYWRALSLPLFYRAMGMTAWLSLSGTLIGLFLAILFAWLIERTDMPLRNLAWSLILIPMAMPGVLFALSWALLLGPNAGVINRFLRDVLEIFGISIATGPINIYSLGGMIFLSGLRGVTTMFMMIVGAFRMMDPALEEAARVSKAGRLATLFHVTLPVLMVSILSAAMYSLVVQMEAFEIPLAIGLPANIFVLSTLIYFTARLQFPTDYGLSAVFGVIFMAIMIVFIGAYRHGLRRFEHYATVTGKGYRPRVISIGGWRYPALALFVVYFLVTVVAPFGILLWASLLPSYRPPSLQVLPLVTLSQYLNIFARSDILRVIWNTLIVMAVTATVTMVLSLFVSWIIVRTRLRGRAILDALMFLPYSVPGIVIALALIMAFLSPPLRSLGIYGTVWFICIGLVVTYIAFGTRLMNGAIIQIHKELEEAAYVSKASSTKTLFTITLPLLFPAFASGWIWVCVHGLRAFSIPLMLASRKNYIYSVLIWQYWSDGDIPTAAALGVLLTILLIPLTLIMRKFIAQVSEQQG
jgi:iron(III) transport system permease protein